ncbi:hypothetical protein [Methylorubrum salsuginis]|uniref:Uncharacterized protein n=1 Tax=Methylorubrum salsuginis TaxID=414703 RepID=A0A1I4N7F5_9HYPH|nr:hypothetical protein [Methylorubrum salsuginis]SFM11429.1 hypothetical protein SAMN04488125_1632 [Methylorubrum salsuginis]
MTGFDPAPSHRVASPAPRGSPSRRRLLAILGSLSLIGTQSGATEPHRTGIADTGTTIDPMPRLFAEFESLLDQHDAALAACDRIEAGLLAGISFPRVRLPGGADGARRYAADFPTIAWAVPPGRCRQRFIQRLHRRQRQWDTAAQEAGLLEAELHEASIDGAVLAAADNLLATPARTCHAVVLKLIVLLSVHAPGPVADTETPWRELRLILADLNGLAADRARGRWPSG